MRAFHNQRVIITQETDSVQKQTALLLVHSLSLESLEGGNADMGNHRVQLFLGVLVIITLARQPDANTVRHILDTMSPHNLVQRRLHTHILGAHHLLGKGTDGLDGGGGALLEGLAVDVFVEVDGGLTGDDVGDGGALGAFVGGHVGYELVDGWMAVGKVGSNGRMRPGSVIIDNRVHPGCLTVLMC